MVCLKPCDTYSFNQLIKEHRVDRQSLYRGRVGCKGKLDIEKIRKQGVKGIESIKGAEITDEADNLTIQTLYGKRPAPMRTPCWRDAMCAKAKSTRFAMMKSSESPKIRRMRTASDRGSAHRGDEPWKRNLHFSRRELSKCIRCNACRNALSGVQLPQMCVFDSNNSTAPRKRNVDSFEEKMFHIIRAFHVAGRCTDCGECSRVCPQGIPSASVQPEIHQGYQ